LDLWQAVVKDIVPIPEDLREKSETIEKSAGKNSVKISGQVGSPKIPVLPTKPAPKSSPKSVPQPSVKPSPKKTTKRPEVIVSAPRALTSPTMDRRNFNRLQKGQMPIDARLDLHGMTVEQAKLRLKSFLLNAHAGGDRVILVITGKGLRSGFDEFNRPNRGVIREGLPQWVKDKALAPMIVQITPAHRQHGGDGAFYLYLRRKR
ncbi:MAG: Smr/MutS family protein, partial [Proteobacteria bacterium]|nr:Smr/MutS family protein [Pseudomonadota bacterium]